MTYSRSDFVSMLRDFAAGITPVASFHEWITSVLVTEGPSVTRNEQGALGAIFPFEADCAMYLDMVTGADDPNYDENEGRRLAGALCAIATQIEDSEVQSLLAELARWAPRTVEGIREYLSSGRDRHGFERFISRRPWTDEVKSIVIQLDHGQLAEIAQGLEINDYRLIWSSLTS